MRTLTTCLAAAALLLAAASRASADDPKPGPDYEQLKNLAWMIGDWEAETTVPPGGDPAPGARPPGSKVRHERSSFWMEGRNYIGFKFRDTIAGKVAHQGFEMIGVDPKSRKVIHWLFTPLGGYGTGEWSSEGKTWKLKWSGTAGDGTFYEGVSTLVPVDANTYTWQMKENKKNGVKGPDTPVVTFRRVAGKPAGTSPPAPAAAATVSPAYAHLKVLEPMVGQWRTTAQVNGQPLTGDFDCRWLPGKSALAWTAWIDPKGGGRRQYYGGGLFVWDARAKVIKEHVTVANGETQLTLLKPAGPDKVAWDRTYIAPDGKTSTETFETTFTKDKIVFTDSQQVDEGGKVLSRWRDGVFTRVAPDPGAALGLPPLGDDPPTAKEYLDFWNRYFVGTWDVRLLEGPFPGKAGVQEIRQAPGGSSMQFRARIEGKDYFSGAGGYDPATRSWKEVHFLNDGGTLTEHHRIPRGILTGDPAGKTLMGVTTTVRPDGTVERSTHRIDILDKDTYLYTTTPVQVDGNTPAPIKTESKRQPK